MGPVIAEKSQSEETALTGGCGSARKRQTRSEAKKNRSNTVNNLPPYNEMIIEAINEIMQRTKFSQYAITKTIREKYKKTLPYNFNVKLWKELKDLTEKGVLVRTNNSFKFSNGFNKARKSHANQTSNSVRMVFPTRVRSPKARENCASAMPNDIDDAAEDAESARVQEETQLAQPTGSGSKVFIFKGTVENAHFQ
eukprot:PITA_07259